MKILLAIPSKKRAHILAEYALHWVPLVGLPWRVFVEQEDFNDYVAAGVSREHLFVLPKSNCGLGFSKVWIKNYAQEHGYDAIFKVDDDVKGWSNFRKRQSAGESAVFLAEIIKKCERVMQEDDSVAGISFPYSFQMFEQYEFKKTKRVQTCYLFRTEFFHADERISVHEDFAVGLYAIVNGRQVLMCGLTGQELGVKVGGNKKDPHGGHQALNRVRGAEEVQPYLREIYPPLQFREVDKPWKTEPDLRSVKKVGLY
jgi:hypothetical protein